MSKHRTYQFSHNGQNFNLEPQKFPFAKKEESRESEKLVTPPVYSFAQKRLDIKENESFSQQSNALSNRSEAERV